jgi:hypothetical protein
MTKDVLFVSWCPLKLLRPRAFQVSRAAKALRLRKWRPYLICSDFANDIDLFDSEIEAWHRASFVKVRAFTDPAFLDHSAQQGGTKSAVRLGWGRRPRNNKNHEPWTDAAAAAARRWCRWRRRPIVMSFGQPWASHIAVLAAKQARPQLRWAAHFSDPWVDNPYVPQRSGPELEAARRQEREVVEQADAVVFVTEDAADLVMRKYPPEWRHKVHVISHLLDLDWQPPLSFGPANSDRLRLLHTGNLYNGIRAPNGLFETLSDYHSDAPFTFRFVGWAPDSALKSLGDASRRGLISWTSPLYYSPCLKEMAGADVLVVIDADFAASPFLPSKIFDYLLFDKPMLGLTPANSATARFLKQLGYPVVGPNDVGGIRETLEKLIQMWRGGQLQPTAAHHEARRACDVRAAGLRYAELAEALRSKGP